MKLMIHHISLLLLIFIAYACNNNSTVQGQITPEPQLPTTAVSKKEVVNAAVPVVATQANNKEELVTTFPFDIELKDVEGQIHKSQDIFKKNGKPTVLLFWLTTCRPCHMKLNAIKPLYSGWIKEADFNVYAISGDFAKNYPKFVTQTKAKGWEWKTYNDVNRSFRKVLPGGLNGYPQTFIFDKEGKLVYQDKKYRPGDEKKLFQKIKEICNS